MLPTTINSFSSLFVISYVPPDQRVFELRASIERKRKTIEHYNTMLVGLIFEVAEEEQLLRRLESASISN